MAAFKPYECLMRHSTCYEKTTKLPKVLGVLWHSTGAPNTWLCRYVQPYEGEKDYDAKIKKLGKNRNGNDWNHAYKKAGVNFFIGKDAEGNIEAVQVLFDQARPWGCGTRYKNGPTCNDGFIQFEICEDSLNDKDYAEKVWKKAVELTAWLCEKYSIDPLATVEKRDYYGNIKQVPTILDHITSWELGFGSGHGDIRHWFKKILGKDMSDARKEVYALLPKDGWVERDGDWYYYSNNKYTVGWAKINKKWYYFNDKGIMQTGWFEDGKKTYYLKPSGQMVTGWQYIDDVWYFFATSGAMKTGWLKHKKQWYYLDTDGKMITGWKVVDKKPYYFSADGHMASNEWIYDDNIGHTDRGYWWISKDGVFKYKYKGSWHENKQKKWWFKDESGWYAKDETIKIRGIFYTFDSEGFMLDDITTDPKDDDCPDCDDGCI